MFGWCGRQLRDAGESLLILVEIWNVARLSVSRERVSEVRIKVIQKDVTPRGNISARESSKYRQVGYGGAKVTRCVL